MHSQEACTSCLPIKTPSTSPSHELGTRPYLEKSLTSEVVVQVRERPEQSGLSCSGGSTHEQELLGKQRERDIREKLSASKSNRQILHLQQRRNTCR
jgi:hypothetical protein